MSERRKPTSTSNFGVGRRENHDASDFYARFTPPVLDRSNTVEPAKAVDEIFCGDARDMATIPTGSVALVVTSPPYFAGKEYEEALGEGHAPATYLEYLRMLEDVFAECLRTLEPGGRLAINVANLGRKPFRSLSADVTDIVQNKLRMLLRGEIVWVKARGSTGSCAWGSFQRPANPVLRDLTERVIVASKGRFDRALPARDRARRGLPSESSMSRDEFMEATTDVWEMPPESATRVGHPAPFPVDLPIRLIHLYTYYGDLVLDPFMGSGTTAVAAMRTGRHFAGYDTDPDYVARARERVAGERRRTDAGPDAGGDRPRFVLPALAVDAPPVEGPYARALREGLGARDVARALVEESGFEAVEADVKVGGVDVSLRAHDRSGRPWHFEVAGGFTSHRPGLKRTDVLWRALGKALVLQEAEPKVPLVLLTPERPTMGTPGALALQQVCGPDKAVRAVVEMPSADDRRVLRELAAGGAPLS